ncbi:MAG: HAD hydrolase-like protein [Oscillospiraceae bacterium]
MNEKKLVVFDLDGTLNKTELYAVPAHRKALAELNISDKSDELIISTFGARGIDCVHLLINTTDEKEAYDYFKKVSQYENEFITQFAGEFEGTSAMLDTLRKDGYHIAVCSNASERYIRMVLSALNIIDKIDYIQPLLLDMIKDDTLKFLLEREMPDKAVMVGDRVFDKNAARANAIPFIGCMYGFENSEVADADIAVKEPSEINDAVKKLIG